MQSVTQNSWDDGPRACATQITSHAQYSITKLQQPLKSISIESIIARARRKITYMDQWSALAHTQLCLIYLHNMRTKTNWLHCLDNGKSLQMPSLRRSIYFVCGLGRFMIGKVAIILWSPPCCSSRDPRQKCFRACQVKPVSAMYDYRKVIRTIIKGAFIRLPVVGTSNICLFLTLHWNFHEHCFLFNHLTTKIYNSYPELVFPNYLHTLTNYLPICN